MGIALVLFQLLDFIFLQSIPSFMWLIANVDIKLCCTFLRFVQVSPQQNFQIKPCLCVCISAVGGGGNTKYLLR